MNYYQKYLKYRQKYLSLKQNNKLGGSLEDEIFETHIHCILIMEDVREAYLIYSKEYLQKCIEYIKTNFPSLYIFNDIHDESEDDPDMPKLKNIDKNVNVIHDKSRYFISKKKLTNLDIDTDDKIGRLLGYNCLFSLEPKFVFSFYFISKSGKNIHLFSYSCTSTSPEKISKEQLIYAKQLTDKIKIAFK